MIVVMLGAPGAGKGTQAKVLAARYNLIHLATGDIFRSEIAQNTPLGEKAQGYMKSGKLVPDELVTEMVAGRMEADKNYLLDGFPRTIDQAQSFSANLEKEKLEVALAVLLRLPNEEAMKRLTARRVCGSCSEVFNILTKKPKVEDKCDSCSSKLVQRVDDTEETAKKRLMVYEDLTEPLVSFYRTEGVLREVDAAGPPEQVTESLIQVFDGVLTQKA